MRNLNYFKEIMAGVAVELRAEHSVIITCYDILKRDIPPKLPSQKGSIILGSSDSCVLPERSAEPFLWLNHPCGWQCVPPASGL
jgi:hypothetical protein